MRRIGLGSLSRPSSLTWQQRDGSGERLMSEPKGPGDGGFSSRSTRHGDWDHLMDPRFWGLDADSLRRWGLGAPDIPGQGGAADADAAGLAELEKRLAAIEVGLIAMNQRLSALERPSADDEAAPAAEIDRLREEKGVARWTVQRF